MLTDKELLEERQQDIARRRRDLTILRELSVICQNLKLSVTIDELCNYYRVGNEKWYDPFVAVCGIHRSLTKAGIKLPPLTQMFEEAKSQ
jgi:hypothetical protein